MNATEQANNPYLAGKISQLGSIFKQEFPEAKVDLAPWSTNNETQKYLDPDSIDVSFNFLGYKPDYEMNRTILVQIRFSDNLWMDEAKIIGIEMAGYNYKGQQWRLSTIGDWNCEGRNVPASPIQIKIKNFCQNTLNLFQEEMAIKSSLNKLFSSDLPINSNIDPNDQVDNDEQSS